MEDGSSSPLPRRHRRHCNQQPSTRLHVCGVRCGADTGSQFDCYMNDITNNFITNPWWYSSLYDRHQQRGDLHVHALLQPGESHLVQLHLQRPVVHVPRHGLFGAHYSGGVCNGSYATVKVNGGSCKQTLTQTPSSSLIISTVQYSTVQYSTVSTVLYCTVLYCTVLYCTVLPYFHWSVRPFLGLRKGGACIWGCATV